MLSIRKRARTDLHTINSENISFPVLTAGGNVARPTFLGRAVPGEEVEDPEEKPSANFRRCERASIAAIKPATKIALREARFRRAIIRDGIRGRIRFAGNLKNPNLQVRAYTYAAAQHCARARVSINLWMLPVSRCVKLRIAFCREFHRELYIVDVCVCV